MKTNKILAIGSLFLLSAATFSVVSAESSNTVSLRNGDIKSQTDGKGTSTEAKRINNNNATGTFEKNDNSTSTKEREDNATNTENNGANDENELNADSHRSDVALFVHSLLDIANREGGIGNQVRLIAQSQNDSATTTASAMDKVEEQSSLRTFFFGSDYKNLGVIRSELATTTANIEKLKVLLGSVTNVADRASLGVQIQALEAEQAKLDSYITNHENMFSLFGWFTKMFSK